MKNIKILSLIIFLAFSSTLLMAGKYEHQATGVSIWVPDQWQAKVIGEAIYAISPDGSAVVKYIGLHTRDLQAARNNYRAYLDPQVQNVRVFGQAETFQNHRLQFEGIQGEARDQRPMKQGQWLWKMKIYLITTPREIGMLVLRHLDGSTYPRVPFENVLGSIKPL